MKVVEQEFMTTARRAHEPSVRSKRVNSISHSLLGLQGNNGGRGGVGDTLC
ncbi:hypothetical protein M2318_003776 [Metapseudomonas resinovorans]